MIVMGAFGKLLPPEWRTLAFGAGTAAGSFGQFLFSPLAVVLIDQIGWQHTLVIFALILCLIIPLASALASPRDTPPTTARARAQQQSIAQALAEAFGHKSYVLLVLGYFTCGFQTFFMSVHLPAYLVDRGLPAEIGGWTLAVIGLFNIVGAIAAGWLSAFLPKRYILAFIYFWTCRGDPRLHHAAAERGRDLGLRRRIGIVLAFDRAADLGAGCGDVWHALDYHAVRSHLLQPPGRRLPGCVAWRRAVRADRFLRRDMVALDLARPLVGGH
jgi:MFS family permease